MTADLARPPQTIDSAGFGPINITKSVTITSPNGVEAGIVPVASGDAIDINAGPNDAIVLRGLTLNGSGVGGNGVVFNSGGSLTGTNCTAQNFTDGSGILIGPTSGTVDVVIIKSITANVAGGLGAGIRLVASGDAIINAVIDHVVATGNDYGIAADPNSSGLTAVAISNSVASNNLITGIAGSSGISGGLGVSIDNVTASGNSFGIAMAG